jgi:hypothetical protein
MLLTAKIPYRAVTCFDNQSLPICGIMTLGHYYGIPGMNAGQHSCGGSHSYLSCLPRVPIGAESLWAKHSKMVYPTHMEGWEWGAWVLTTHATPGAFSCALPGLNAHVSHSQGSAGIPPSPQASFLGPGNSRGVLFTTGLAT